MNSFEKTLVTVMVVAGILCVLKAYVISGLYWDFTVHFLMSKALLTPAFWHYMLSGSASIWTITTKSFYIEGYRTPLIILLMVPFTSALGAYAVPAYLVSIIMLLLLSLYYLSRTTRITFVTLTLLFFNPFTLFTILLLNGSELLSMVLIITSVALLVARRWEAGIALSLAALAKYPSFIFLPLIFLLPAEKRVKALASYVVVLLPWVAYNVMAFHSPFASLVAEQTSYVLNTATGGGLIPISLEITFSALLPAVLVIIVLFLKAVKPRFDLCVIEASFVSVIGLGTVAWLYLVMHGSINSTPRMGYLLYVGAAIALAYVFDRMTLSTKGIALTSMRTLGLAFIFICGIATLVYYYYYSASGHSIFQTEGTDYPSFALAKQALVQHGLPPTCDVVSNAWVYLYYDGVTAFSPYQPNAPVSSMPALIFYEIGTSSSAINTTGYTMYNYGAANFTLAIPPHYNCSAS